MTYLCRNGMTDSGNIDVIIIHGNFTICDDIFEFIMSKKFVKGKVIDNTILNIQ